MLLFFFFKLQHARENEGQSVYFFTRHRSLHSQINFNDQKKKKKKRYVFYHNYWQCSEVQNITRLDLQAFTHTHTHTWTPKHNLKQVGADRHTHKQKHQQKQFNNNLCHKNPQDEQKKTVLWNGSVCVCVCLSKTIQEWAQKNKKKKSAQSLKDEGIRTVSQRVP